MPAMRASRRHTVRGAALVLLVASAVQAHAAPFQCAPLVPSRSRQPAYGPATGQPRCEGFYERNVSQPFVELVSLTRWPPGQWSGDAEGRITLRGLPKVDTRLLIQPLRSNPLYRVDASLAKGAGVVWTSRPMLQATGLRERDLGFLALAGSDPLVVAPVASQTPPEGSTAYAVLRPSVAVASIAWRAWRPGDTSTLPGAWQDLTRQPLFAWERIVLPIALPADGRGMRVDVRAVDPQGQPLPLLQFTLLGVADEAP